MDRPPTLLHHSSHLGRGYLAAMELAGRYAYAGREWVAGQVLDVLGGEEVSRVHNHHNHGWREEAAGAPAWVVREGCTPAFAGQRGFVGGSMGDDAVILEGVGGEATRALLHSTVHGAGRVFGRNQAKRTFTRAQMETRDQPLLRVWSWSAPSPARKWRRGCASAAWRCAAATWTRASMTHRRLPDVLARHAGMVRVLHTLRPFAGAMAGAGEVDPYKD